MHLITIPMEALAELIMVQLKENGKANLNVTGSSMKPMLQHRRDSVNLIPVKKLRKQKKGDVILYRRENGKYILHRIVAVTREGYICCGDNQAEKEEVTHDQLIAVVDGFTRKGKAYSVSNRGYRVYTRLMTGLFFLRPAYIALRRPIGRILGKIRRKKQKKASQ